MAVRNPPVPDADTAPFWDACNHGELTYQRCTACGRVQFPPGRFCRSCQACAMEWRRSAGLGTVHSFTVVHRPPSPAFKDDVPYVIALVDLDEGFRMMLNLRGAPVEQAAMGQRVRVGFAPTSEPGRKLPQAEAIV